MIKNKSIFITGGAGFIANTIISRLVEHNKITVYDNFHRDTLTGSPFHNHSNIAVVHGDVLDLPALTDAMKGANIVIHAAGIAGIDTVIKSPVNTMRVNMIGTANMLEAAHINKVSDRVIDFSTGKIKRFATKKSLSGQGCNFQRHCHRAIFIGIDYEFNDFIQAIHRIYRFLQGEKVIIDIIFTESEQQIYKALMRKWKQHDELQEKMIAIVKKYGLSGVTEDRMARSISVS